jgi:DNA topoisomerase-1
MASQMATRRLRHHDGGLRPRRDGGRRYLFRSTGSVVKFQGFLALYKEAREEGDAKALEDEQALPALDVDARVPVREITPSQHFTEPPPRFSEASLVKELERLGIGRPSTYASIISTLVDRRYSELQQRRFFPTELGETVAKVMVKQFPDIFDVGFTSAMEGELDKVEEGTVGWRAVLTDFYKPFAARLTDVDYEGLIAQAHDLSALETERCPTAAGSCSQGRLLRPLPRLREPPKSCKYTRPSRASASRPSHRLRLHRVRAQMLKRTGRTGDFLGCSRFPSAAARARCPPASLPQGQRRDRRAALEEAGQGVLRLRELPALRLRLLGQAGEGELPECGFVGAEAKSNKTRGDYRSASSARTSGRRPRPRRSSARKWWRCRGTASSVQRIAFRVRTSARLLFAKR